MLGHRDFANRLIVLLPNFMTQNMKAKVPARKRKKSDTATRKNNKDVEAVIVGKIIKKMMNANLLGGALVAGAFAYEASKKSREPFDEIAGQAVARIPKNIRQKLTASDKKIIRDAIKNALVEIRK